MASRRAECGYVVYAGLEEKLDAKSYKRSIGVYSAPSTVAAALSTETVFAALMEIYDGELLADYVAENELFDPLGTAGGEAREKAAAQARELYAKWLESGSTFRFQYQFQGRDGEDREDVYKRQGMSPCTYNQYAWDKLDRVMDAAAARGLSVMLRVGYTWDYCGRCV